MNARAQKMTSLVESCPGFADALRLFVGTLEAQFSDDPSPPCELAAALLALETAVAAVQALDEACA